MSTEEFFPADFLTKIEHLAFIAKRINRGRSRGEHLTYRRGSSLEFYDYREYQAGDDPRYIDWNIYERLGKLVTKMFSAEEDLTIHFLLDASASMSFGSPSKLLYESRLCAALSYIALAHLDRVGITWFTDVPKGTLPPVRRRDIFPILSFLSDIETGGETGFNRSLGEFARTARIPGLAVVISDLLAPDGFREGLLSLVYRHWDIVLLHLIDRDEYDPGYRGDMRLIDAETGRGMDLVVDRNVREMFSAETARHIRGIERFCMDKRIEYVPVRTEEPFEKVILTYLKRGMHLH